MRLLAPSASIIAVFAAMIEKAGKAERLEGD
jgi:hypothetical protein